MKRIRVFLADDHDLFREGLAGIISSQEDMEVVGDASDGLEAVVKAIEIKPDLILMDIQMPGCNGLEATQKIKKEFPEAVIIILTVRDDEEKLFEAIRNGAQGYLLKSIRSRDLLEMLRGAMRGEAAIKPLLAGRMLDEFRRLSQVEPKGGEAESVLLSYREQEVLGLVSRGLTDKQIAAELSISLHTVKSHLRNILSKLQVGNRHEAASYAKNKGLSQA